MRFISLSIMPLLILVIFAFGCGNRPKTQDKPNLSLFEKQGTLTFLDTSGTAVTSVDIEIADSPKKRETGMMGRPMLGEKNGMLFVFEQEQYLAFWMMNTMISLDMIFINANKRIVTIQRNAVPYSQESYAADSPGQYVLEVNAGFCDRYGIQVGQSVEWTHD